MGTGNYSTTLNNNMKLVHYVTVHPSTASVLITVLLNFGQLLCDCNGLNARRSWTDIEQLNTP